MAREIAAEAPAVAAEEIVNEESQAVAEGHRSGFVNIVGNPNVGKSTLMNDLVGERISIITSKAQTTRHRIMGIVNTPQYQIVYSDTPGVLKPKYKLQESMLGFSEGALTDADILLYVTDVVEDPEKKIVDIVTERTGAMITVVVTNYFSDQLQFFDGMPATTKKEEEGFHGFGMKSMKILAEKYHGSVHARTEGDVFVLTICIFDVR